MKKLFKVALVAVCVLFTANLAKAQTKIGYVNFNAVIDAMPAKATLTKTLQDYQKTFVDQAQLMQTEYQTKFAAYDKTKTTMSDAARIQAEGELTDIQKRMETFNQQAQQKLEARQQELAKPILDNVKLAVTAVAKEKGYAYVFDSSQQIMIVSPDADDLTAAVKLKLAIK